MDYLRIKQNGVAPLVGAWIEIYFLMRFYKCFLVAPLVGAWIEISAKKKSLLSQQVTPLVGV